MDEKEQYKALITEIITKQSVILGPEISILKARNVAELSITDDGQVTDIDGPNSVALQKLIDEYIALSGEIVRNVTRPIFEKYPDIKFNIN
jgi:hypothetical protein